jgi:hypothetical protein
MKRADKAAESFSPVAAALYSVCGETVPGWFRLLSLRRKGILPVCGGGLSCHAKAFFYDIRENHNANKSPEY